MRHAALVPALTSVAALAACAARPPPPPAPAPPPADAHESDPSFDWQSLMIAPMGSTLKAVPVVLHEALLFHDEAADSKASDDGECYSPDSAPPRFLGRTPDQYLLCFRQDHLLRVRASLSLGEDADSIFHEACARWLRKAAQAAGHPGESADEPAGDTTGPEGAPDPATCKGRSGSVRFHARLGADSDQSAPGSAEDAAPRPAVPGDAEGAKAATLLVVLDGVPD
ncbi:MAG TPA: hypothetical protein VHV81_03580 [Steroidobacteraceae bacterium]|jgi:hypothetical protein|nr:hypothetical protein [Steroidobacteraceae bacterium]